MAIDSDQTIDIREQLARIDKLDAETKKITLEIMPATPQMFFQASLASAALIGAGVAAFKLFL